MTQTLPPKRKRHPAPKTQTPTVTVTEPGKKEGSQSNTGAPPRHQSAAKPHPTATERTSKARHNIAKRKASRGSERSNICPPSVLGSNRIAGRPGLMSASTCTTEHRSGRQPSGQGDINPKAPIYVPPTPSVPSSRARATSLDLRSRPRSPTHSCSATRSWLAVSPSRRRIWSGSTRRPRAATSLPWQVLAAINYVETGYGADVNFSSAGAKGWMQFMPATWREYGDGDRRARRSGCPTRWPIRGTRATRSSPQPSTWQQTARIRAFRQAIFAYNHAGVVCPGSAVGRRGD